MSRKKKYVILTSVLVCFIILLIYMALCNPQIEKEPVLGLPDVLQTESSRMTEYDASDMIEDDGGDFISEGMFFGPVPEQIRPVVLVNGKRYYWMAKSSILEGANTPNGQVTRCFPAVSILPDNYTEYGSLKEVTRNEPTKDGQMKAGFMVSEGTIYTSEFTPEAVYVRMTCDWIEGEHYYRFISEELDNGYRIRWGGKYYFIKNSKCEILPQVPENCVSIGTLDYVGRDMIPKNDLETNRPSAGGYALEGREVFFNADEPEYIYVYETIPGSSVYKCPLWEVTQDNAHSTLEPTAAPDENYVFIADVVEIDGAYYHFRDLGEDSIPTKEEEETILPQLEHLGRTTRVDWIYPKKELEANCLPDGTEVYYHAEADKFAFFWDDKPYHWWYTGKYCVCDKDEMVPGKYYSFSEYGDDVLYSLGWIEDVYEYNTKILGYILEMKDGSLLVQGVTDEEKASYECLWTDKYTQYEEDTRVYKKSHVSSEEDIDLTVPHYIYVKNNKVSAIIPEEIQK